MIKNKDYFMEKWYKGLESDNVLVRYKAKQFIAILASTVYDGGRLILSLLDGTAIGCTTNRVSKLVPKF